jgi:predicted transcriptional regulator
MPASFTVCRSSRDVLGEVTEREMRDKSDKSRNERVMTGNIKEWMQTLQRHEEINKAGINDFKIDLKIWHRPD